MNAPKSTLQRYSLNIGRKYKDRDNVERTAYTRVGTIWEKEKDGKIYLSVQLEEQLAVSGSLVAFVDEPKEEREPAESPPPRGRR